jgi:hypothetical protein
MMCSFISLFSLFRPYNRFLKLGSCQEGVKIPWKIGQKGALTRRPSSRRWVHLCRLFVVLNAYKA